MRVGIQANSAAGQSATEFALMLPIILMFIFFILQVNIAFTVAHQAAWASYAAARFHIVARHPSDDESDFQDGTETEEIVDELLTGRIYKRIREAGGGYGVEWVHDGGGGGADVSAKGGKLVFSAPAPSFGSGTGTSTMDARITHLPYVGRMLPIGISASGSSWEIPTHLGKNEYAEWDDDERNTNSTNAQTTDNNLDDF